MNDYLHNLVARSLNRAECARPRTPTIFEPLQPALNSSAGEFFNGLREESADVEEEQTFVERVPEQRRANQSKRVERRTVEPPAELPSLESSEAQAKTPVVHTPVVQRETARVTDAPKPSARTSNPPPATHAPTLDLQPADTPLKGVREAKREESKQAEASPAPARSHLPEPSHVISVMAVRAEPPVPPARANKSEPAPPTSTAPAPPSRVAQRDPEPHVIERVSVREVEGEAMGARRPPEAVSEARVPPAQQVSRIEPPADEPVHASRTQAAVQPRITRHTAPPMKEQAPAEPVQAQDTETEHTVQVTIGRIEVRAVAASDAQQKGSRRRAQQKQSLMSLDDYLRQRASGGHR